MPRYLWDVKEHLLFDEEVKRMFDLCKDDYERLALSLMWRAAPRPMEMLGEVLQSKKIVVGDDNIRIILKTLKLGEGGDYTAEDRPLDFARPTGLDEDPYLETIARMAAKTPPEAPMVPYSKRWLERFANRMGIAVLGRPITPYHFRHSRMTWLARNRASLDQLKHFKGAADYRSVWGYINATPFVVSLELSRAGKTPEPVAPPKHYNYPLPQKKPVAKEQEGQTPQTSGNPPAENKEAVPEKETPAQ